MKYNINPNVCIQLTDDEFFILVAILHQINCNIEPVEGENFRSHTDFLFTGNCDNRARTGYCSYNTFRSLSGKVYDTNLKKAVKNTEAWI